MLAYYQMAGQVGIISGGKERGLGLGEEGGKLDSCRLGPAATRRQARHGGLGGLGGPALPLDLSPHSKEAAEEPPTCAWLRPTWWPLWHTSLRLRSQNGTTGTTKTTETARVGRDGRFGPRAAREAGSAGRET